MYNHFSMSEDHVYLVGDTYIGWQIGPSFWMTRINIFHCIAAVLGLALNAFKYVLFMNMYSITLRRSYVQSINTSPLKGISGAAPEWRKSTCS